jgi:hypothetical protein
VLRITAAAREMGLCAIGIVDGDTTPEAVAYVASHTGDANAIIRLPDARAIEYAIVHNVPADTIRQALNDVSGAMTLPAIPNLTALTGKALESQAITFIKKNMLHAAFIDALPFDALAPLAKTLLEKAMLAAREQLNGVIQL